MADGLEAEAAVLGCLLTDDDCAADVLPVLKAFDFADSRHQVLYEVMVSKHNRSEAADPVTVIDWIDRTGKVEAVGGFEYVAHLLDVVPTTANAVWYAKIVRSHSQRREILGAAAEIKSLIEAGNLDGDELVTTCEDKIYRATAKHSSAALVSASARVRVLGHEYTDKDRPQDRYRGIPTGLADLDYIVDGYKKGVLYILAARPSLGKSALAWYTAMNAADEGVGVLYVTLEMTADEIISRGLARYSGIDERKIQRNQLLDSDYPSIHRAVQQMEAWEDRVWFDHSGTATVGHINSLARRMQHKHGLGLVVVDYLQLVTGHQGGSRNDEVASVSRGLKAMAMALNVPVVAVSQLNREVEKGGQERRPRLSDLRDSGAIEQDANVVMFLWRNPSDSIQADGEPLELVVAKQRGGPKGDVKLVYDKKTTRFWCRETFRQADI